MARHPGVVATATLQVAYGILDIIQTLIRRLMYNCYLICVWGVNFRHTEPRGNGSREGVPFRLWGYF